MADVDDRSLQLEIVLIILVLTCLATVSARCYTMGFILKRFFVEDYLAVLALVSKKAHFPCILIFNMLLNLVPEVEKNGWATRGPAGPAETQDRLLTCGHPPIYLQMAKPVKI